MLFEKVSIWLFKPLGFLVLYQPTEKGSWVSVVPIYPAHLGKDHQIRGLSCWTPLPIMTVASPPFLNWEQNPTTEQTNVQTGVSWSKEHKAPFPGQGRPGYYAAMTQEWPGCHRSGPRYAKGSHLYPTVHLSLLLGLTTNTHPFAL